MAPSARQEYWRPPNPEGVRLVQPVSIDSACSHCGAEYPAGARFCHICGSDRDPRPSLVLRPMTFADFLDLAILRQRLGLSVACLVFFIIGIVCMAAAVLTGFIYRADTLPQWQAIQVWRIEWLLGAAAALLAGVLLKKKDS
ncbi:MAG: zinc ribbon domain-containing protein [Candidatus Korobacteraceae bacterium]